MLTFLSRLGAYEENQRNARSRSSLSRSQARQQVCGWRCSAKGLGLERCCVGEPAFFIVEGVDQHGTALQMKHGQRNAAVEMGKVAAVLHGPCRVHCRVVKHIDTVDSGLETRLMYTCSISGTYRLEVFVDGHHVVGSPFTVVAAPAEPHGPSFSVLGTLTDISCLHSGFHPPAAVAVATEALKRKKCVLARRSFIVAGQLCEVGDDLRALYCWCSTLIMNPRLSFPCISLPLLFVTARAMRGPWTAAVHFL